MYTEFLIYMGAEGTDGFHTKISIFAGGGVGGEVRKTGMTCEINFIASMETLLLFAEPFFRRVRKIAKIDY